MGSFYGGGSDNITVTINSGTGGSSGTTASKEESLTNMIGLMPFYYAREYLPTADKISITIHANTQVNINNVGYYTTKDTTLSTSGVAEAGKDIYIYACTPKSGSTPDFVLSQNSTVPEGYNADTSRKIGGFHCLCADVGIIEGHPLSGYQAGDILPASIWDLEHRPVSDPEGMVFDEGTQKWYDIYLTSWDGSKLTSQYNGLVVSGVTSTPFHGLKFKECMGQIGKRLLWRHEFMCVAKGSNENTAIEGAADPITTGGHIDSSGRRMISNIGLEDCCGVFWQWVNDEYEDLMYGTTDDDYATTYFKTDSQHKYFVNYHWGNTLTSEGNIANYDESVDSQEYGDSYGLPRQGHVGGYWGCDGNSGSRAILTNNFGSSVSAGTGARGVSDRR